MMPGMVCLFGSYCTLIAKRCGAIIEGADSNDRIYLYDMQEWHQDFSPEPSVHPPKGIPAMYTGSMKKLEMLFGVLRIPLDILAVGGALVLSYQLRLLRIDLIPGVQLLDPATTLPMLPEYIQTFVVPGAVLFLLIGLLLRLYAFQVTQSAWLEVGRSIVAAIVWLACIMAWYFLIRRQLFYSRILLLHAAFFIILFTVIGRAALVLLYRALLHLGYGVRHVASFGRQELMEGARRTLQDDPRYHFCGHVHTVGGLRAIHAEEPLDLVLQTDPDPTSEETAALIEECRSQHIGYAFLPPVLAEVPQQLKVAHLGLLPVIHLVPTPLDGWGRVLKRLFDTMLSALLLLLLSPILLLIAVLIFIESGWPVFYISRRVGDQGRCSIPVLKFRSMRRDADAHRAAFLALNHRNDGPLFKVRDDPRTTPLGRLLRRWSLDELPQLFNVFIGQMSLVGPRPHLPEEVQYYTPYQRRVFAVRPGITGLSQISGRSDLRFGDEVCLDLQYIEEWSPLLDLWILWRTVFVVLNRNGAD